MAGGVTFATARSFLGVAKEVTKGTGVAPTAFIPVRTFDADPKQTKLIDSGWRGSMGDNFGMQNGVRSAELSIAGDVFSDTIGYFLAGVLGDVTVTGASTPYTHAASLLNSGTGVPTAYTFTDVVGALDQRQYPGCQITEVGLKYDASGLLTYDAKALGYIDSSVSLPTPAFSSVIPMPSWLAAVTLGGVAAPNIQSMEFNLKRQNGEAVFALGAQDPYAIAVGALQVDGKVTFVAQSTAPYLAFLNNTGPGALSVVWNQGASSQVKLQATNCQYDDSKFVKGKAYVEIETTFKAILNTTDAGASGGVSPCKATVVNALPSGTFA